MAHIARILALLLVLSAASAQQLRGAGERPHGVEVHAEVVVPDGHAAEEYRGKAQDDELGQVVADDVFNTPGLESVSDGDISVHGGESVFTEPPTATPVTEPPTAAQEAPSAEPGTPAPSVIDNADAAHASAKGEVEWLARLGVVPWVLAALLCVTVVVAFGGAVSQRALRRQTHHALETAQPPPLQQQWSSEGLALVTLDVPASVDVPSSSWWARGSQAAPLISSPDDEHIHAVVVPGGGLAKDGRPPLWVQARLRRAKELYDEIVADAARPAGWRRPYIITLSAGSAHRSVANTARSGKGPDDVYEAEANARFLVDELGAPAADVLQETMSQDTVGNAFFLRTMHSDVAGLRNMIVCTNKFHMPRARAIFERVFALPPFPPALEDGYGLWFEEAPDVGVPPELLFKRCEREGDSLKQFLRVSAGWSALGDLHAFIYRSSRKGSSKSSSSRTRASSRGPPALTDATFCTQCGAHMASDWLFCNQCQSHRPQSSPSRSPEPSPGRSPLWSPATSSRSSRGRSPVQSGRSRQLSSRTDYSYVSGQCSRAGSIASLRG